LSLQRLNKFRESCEVQKHEEKKFDDCAQLFLLAFVVYPNHLCVISSLPPLLVASLAYSYFFKGLLKGAPRVVRDTLANEYGAAMQPSDYEEAAWFAGYRGDIGELLTVKEQGYSLDAPNGRINGTPFYIACALGQLDMVMRRGSIMPACFSLFFNTYIYIYIEC
jgi:hypothetical protein